MYDPFVRQRLAQDIILGRFKFLALVVVALIGAEHFAHAAPKSIKAHRFMNTFGVNIHFGGGDYGDTPEVAKALKRIGFSRVRANCVERASVADWKRLAAAAAQYFPSGLKGDVLITAYLNDPNATLASQLALLPRFAGSIETIEGPNEINNPKLGGGSHGPDSNLDMTSAFADNYGQWAQAIFDGTNGVPALNNAKLLAPTIASDAEADYSSLPDVSSDVTAGTIHFYAGGGKQPSHPGSKSFPAVLGWYQAAVTPGRKIALTECGQSTASQPGQGGCDEATQAKCILNQMFDAAAMGVYRAYIYQLMDGTTDGDPTGAEGLEAHFGLFDYQWRPKAAARALEVLKSLLSDSSSDFTPAVPNYQVYGVANAGLAGDSLSICKSDGSTFIVVWNEPKIWDENMNAPVTPLDDPVTVNFNSSYEYEVFDPLAGKDAIALGQATQISVTLRGSPLLIKLSAGH